MTKVKWHTTCLKCGHTYHASSDCCPNCELEQSWRELAEWHKKQAQDCIKTADLIAADKVPQGEAKRSGPERPKGQRSIDMEHLTSYGPDPDPPPDDEDEGDDGGSEG